MKLIACKDARKESGEDTPQKTKQVKEEKTARRTIGKVKNWSITELDCLNPK